ncbi:MAG: hypothetical protein IKE05_00775 [Clostridia bacterium]|nr:hypothetical protein [Clostridia bacterium]
MKNVIVKAVVKVTKANTKTAHVPFYKGITSTPITSTPITSTPITSTPITSTPITSKDVYNFTLRYVVEMYPAVKPFGNAFMRTAKRFYADLLDIENKCILDMYSADSYAYRFLWTFFNELKNNEYAWNIGDDEATYYRHFLLVSLSNSYFNRFIEACEQ